MPHSGHSVTGSGCLAREIPPGSSPKIIEVKVAVDYANPDVSDVSYVLWPEVSDSGALAMVRTTGNSTQNVFALSIRTCLCQRDFLVFSYRYTSQSDVESLRTQKQTVFLDHVDLRRAQLSYFARQLDFPVRDLSDGEITWTLSGLINNRPIATHGAFALTQPNVYLVVTEDGAVIVTPPNAINPSHR